MTTESAIRAMLDGKKVYRKSWKNDYVDYFYFDGECFRDEQDVLLMCDFHGDDWEIYEEPKPKQIVTIEKWLCLISKNSYYVIEGTKEFMSGSSEKVKLLDAYEVEI